MVSELLAFEVTTSMMLGRVAGIFDSEMVSAAWWHVRTECVTKRNSNLVFIRLILESGISGS